MLVLNTSQKWLYSFVEDYENKALFLPEHQKLRGDVWNDQKKRDWWAKIELTYELSKKAENRNRMHQLSGLITTYELEDDPKRITYLNDGANRTIHSILAYIADCKSKDQDYLPVLRNIQITEQHLLYKNKEEAIQDYIDLNSKGTMATPYEILSCRFISGLDNYETIWSPIFKRIHEVVDSNLLVLGYKGKGKRETAHKMKRDNLALFTRFAAADKSKWSPCVTTPLIDFSKKRHTAVEDALLELCQEKGSLNIKNALDNFDRFLSKYIGFYRQVQQEYGRHNEVNTLTAIRWWLTYSIYHSNNGFDPDTLVLFTRKLFELHGGKTTMIYKSEKGENTNINAQLQQLGNITTVYRALGLTTEEVEERETRKRGKSLVPGLVNSHIKAFSYHGNGETIPENALENALRGSRDMTSEEESRIRRVNSPGSKE